MTFLRKSTLAKIHGVRTRTRAVVSTVLVLVMLTLTACGTGSANPAASPDASGSGQDSDGAMRVVALDWRYEEMLVALGVKPVGIVEIGDSKEPGTLTGQLTGITSVGQAKQPNLEVIASLNPDLILASPTRQGAILDQLKEIAPTETYSDATYTDVLDALQQVGATVGKKDEAQKIVDRINAKITQAHDLVKPGTRAVMAGWAKDTLTVWLPNSFSGSLLQAAGYEYGFEGQKTAVESKTDVAQMTGDKLPGMKLDVLFLYNDPEDFRASPFVTAVPKVVDVEQDVWSRSRGPLAAEAMLDQIINESQ